MMMWKEKVADKLSHLLADSPTHRHRPADADVAPPPPPHVMPPSAEEFPSPKKSSVSSFISSLIPTTSSDRGHKPDTPSSPRGARLLPLPSLPRRWKFNAFSSKHRPLDSTAECGTESESDETVEVLKENIHHVPERSILGSGVAEEASTSQVPGELLPYLMEESIFISSDLFEFFQSSLPNIVKGCQWVLLYSTQKHGISLRTLLRRSVNVSGPCLLIVGDMQGAIFGGLLDSPPKPTAKRKYQGTNQAFIFTTKYGEPRLFRATGANRYYYLCLNDVLAFGGGGNFALCLDEDLLHGTSGPCETFGNLCLAHSTEFELKNVELWGFTYSSRYLT